MCGRYTLRSPAKLVAEVFKLLTVPDLKPRFNIAPTQQVPTVRTSPDTEGRELALLRWGLVPSWADDPSIGNRMINARADTVATKPSFRRAFGQRRCLVVTDGFYEWQKVGTKKQPFYVRMKDGRPFGFAGLWERWERQGEEIESCTIITTDPNEPMKLIHDRMQVIIPPDRYDLWLDPKIRDRASVERLLTPYAPDGMEAYPVSTLVNSPANDVEKCVEKLG